MSVKVLFFASLSERLNLREVEIELAAAPTALAAFCQATGLDAIEPGILVAINQQYAEADADLKDGDEVAFFPPVTGG